MTEKPGVDYAVNYISGQKNLIVHLIQIIQETEDLNTCLYTIEILHKLLTNNEGDKTTIKDILDCTVYLTQLIESMYAIHTKFFSNSQYQEVFLEVHNKLLETILSTHEVKKHRNIAVTSNTTRFLAQLVNLQPKNKIFIGNLIWMLKICCTKKNSEILASKQFYDSLCYFCKITQKVFAVTVILKLMTRNATACSCMSQNEKVFNLILDLTNYNGKKYINKKILITILYRMTKTVYGCKYLSNLENFNKLLYYFVKNEKQSSMGIIKAYTILNRSLNKVYIPSTPLSLDLDLPDNIQTYDKENLSEESDQDSDDSEDEEVEIPKTDTGKLTECLENFPETNDYYKELFSETQNEYEQHTLKIFKNLDSQTIEDRVRRSSKINRNAYPDALALEPESYEHFLDSSTNYFSVESLALKLQYQKEIILRRYQSQVVYDLDQLYQNEDCSVDIPNPDTFEFSDTDVNKDEPNQLEFESRFECGNLRRVTQIEEFEYDLMLNPDTQSNVGHQWFYFQVTKMLPGISYTFNIINFIKINSQHNYGMQPVVFSVAEYQNNKIGWRRAGDKIIYHGNFYTDESESKQYRTLSFSITFSYTNDYVYLAYHYPYTYTRLMKVLLPLTISTPEIYVRVDHLCYTVNGRNEVPLVTITRSLNNSKLLPNRPLVFITARVHPGESNASWIMEGILKFLLSNTDEQAIRACERYIFKIIPMLNPEGVIYGNTRCGLTGTDLNRCWSKPDPVAYPEIYHSKMLIDYAKRKLKLPIASYVDVHGHSRKKFFFLYGCNPMLSWAKRDRQMGDYKNAFKVLPQVLQNFNPHFSFNFCKYKIQRSKEGTGRVVMWREFGIEQSYTLECSYCSGDNGQTMNTKMLADIGVSLIRALSVVA